MFYQTWENVILQLPILIYGCQKVFMIFLNLSLNFWELIGSYLKHITIKKIEIIKTTRQILAKNLIDLLEQYGLKGTNHFLFKRWKV